MRQLKIVKQVTNRDAESLDKYFQEISKIGLITANEEVELALRIKSGDNKALDALVSANLRFVVSVAKQYQGQGLKLSDLINEGNLGLVKAAKRFDETRGFKFISYAVWWIRQSIMQALAEQSRIVRLPLNKIGSINKIKKIYAKLEQDQQRMPTNKELAKQLDMTETEVEQSLKNSKLVKVNSFPFHLNPVNMHKYRHHKWYDFWQELQLAYINFNDTNMPPSITVKSGHYIVN